MQRAAKKQEVKPMDVEETMPDWSSGRGPSGPKRKWLSSPLPHLLPIKSPISIFFTKSSPPRPGDSQWFVIRALYVARSGFNWHACRPRVHCEVLNPRVSSMAPREISSTLRNMKFMQRAAKKQEVKLMEVEETMPDWSSGSGPSGPKRKCIVVTEGNPQPGALRGRMSFQNFNPSIEILNEEVAVQPMQTCSDYQHDCSSGRIEVTPRKIASFRIGSDKNLKGKKPVPVDLKRKQPEVAMEARWPQKLPKNAPQDGDGQSTSVKNRRPFKKQKSEKLNWNVLRPHKPQLRGA